VGKNLLIRIAITFFLFFSFSLYDSAYGNNDCVDKIECVIRIPVTITAYSPRKGETDSTPFITASNKRVREGIIALSRDLEEELELKFGDQIHIEGYGYFQFEDRMHKRKKKHVDIFMFETKRALKFGKQKGNLIIRRLK